MNTSSGNEAKRNERTDRGQREVHAPRENSRSNLARKDDRRHGDRYNVQDAHVSRRYRGSVSIYDLDKISPSNAGSMSYRGYYSNVPDAKR